GVGGAGGGGAPVFTVGLGTADGSRDREVLGITASDPRLDQASIDLHVSTVSYGFGRAPFQLRVLANGQAIETRRVTPMADGSPVDEGVTVSPDLVNPTAYRAEITPEQDEPIAENNGRSDLANPSRRPARVCGSHSRP